MSRRRIAPPPPIRLSSFQRIRRGFLTPTREIVPKIKVPKVDGGQDSEAEPVSEPLARGLGRVQPHELGRLDPQQGQGLQVPPLR